jgi:uncharacterized protein (TIGR02444 family)
MAASETDNLDNPFWQFSLAVYAAPGVADECLALQERYAADVNVLLFGSWLAAARGAALKPQDVESIRAHVSAWHESAVKPLRGVRRWLKDQPGAATSALRGRIKAAELEAEQIEQAMLFAYAQVRWPAAADAGEADLAPANLEVYLQALGYDGAGDEALPCGHLCAAVRALSSGRERVTAMGRT